MRYSKIKIFNYEISKLTDDPASIEKDINEFCHSHAVRDIKFVESTKHEKEYVDDSHILHRDVETPFLSVIIFYNETY